MAITLTGDSTTENTTATSLPLLVVVYMYSVYVDAVVCQGTCLVMNKSSAIKALVAGLLYLLHILETRSFEPRPGPG